MSPYHHGDLRRAVLAAAVTAIAEHGPAAISLRDLARRVGVSHAGPVHHFKDKAGLLTALAAEGFELLAEALVETRDNGGDFVEIGVAYVRFAVDHRAHFEVMFRPDLYHPEDESVATAQARAREVLVSGAGQAAGAGDADIAKLAAWSLVHGFATLWNTGALSDPGDDPERTARAVARMLFGQQSRSGSGS